MQSNTTLLTIPGSLLNDQYIKRIVFMLPIILYVKTFVFDFTLDDVAVIQQNAYVKSGIAGIPKILTTFYWQGFTSANSGIYRPLSLILFAIEYQISHGNPTIFHLFNVFYYALTCWLLYKTMKLVFPHLSNLFSLLMVVFFICHPAHTEVVSNIKSRDEILSLMFLLLTCMVLYEPETSTKPLYKNIKASFLFFLALLSKESSIVFIPLLFIYDYSLGNPVMQIFRKRLFVLFTVIVWGAIHFLVISRNGSVIEYTYNDNSILATTNLFTQKATALGIFARYVVKSFFPYQLSYDYSFNQIPFHSFLSGYTLSGILFLVLGFVVILNHLKKDLLLVVGVSLVLFPLLLVSHIVTPIGTTMADRLLFTPSLGSAIVVCVCLSRFFKLNMNEPQLSLRFILVVLIILTYYVVKTVSRISAWENNTMLFSEDVKTAPNSARVHYNYGTVVLNDSKSDKRTSETIFKKCLAIDSMHYDARVNLGVYYYNCKRMEAAIVEYKKAFAIRPSDPMLCGNIGEAYFKIDEKDSAIKYLEKAQWHGNQLNIINNYLGTLHFDKKQYKASIHYFEKGLQKDLNNWNMYLNYGNALVMENRDQEGINAFMKSLQLNSTNRQTYYFLALTYHKMKDVENTQKYFNLYSSFK